MTVALQAFSATWQPRDKRTRCEWARDNVVVPNMARGSRFDPDATPWAIEPINFAADSRVREMILLWPTGAGKSNFVDVYCSYGASEEEGDVLLATQGDAEAKKYVEKRLVPCLKQIPKVADMLSVMGRFNVKKGSISLPGKTIHWGGVNETHAQATSARAVLVDEAWMAAHGLLEQFHARLHSRWNRQFVGLGQGGEETICIDGQDVPTEWHSSWLRTDQREWSFECPQCREIQRYRLKGLLYEKPGDDSTEWDETAIEQSARYQCIGASRDKPTCDAVFPDRVNVRRDLSRSARYVVQHHKHREHYHGWHLNALGIWYESWGNTAVIHANAHRARKTGDMEPLRLMRQKRMAENYRLEEATPQSPLTYGEYALEDYINGEEWTGEAVRIAGIDRQRDHYWLVVRAWKVDGTSRRVYCGRINTYASVQETLKTLKVKPCNVFQDCSYEPDETYRECAENGWFALRGEDAHDFIFSQTKGRPRKFYSPTRDVRATSGKKCGLIMWATLPVKRILERMRSGRRERWEVERNITPLHERHLFSEVEKDVLTKKTGRVSRLFVARHKDNHTWDCEGEILVGAIIRGMLRDAPEQKAEPAPEHKPA